jgi:hypothetical protein
MLVVETIAQIRREFFVKGKSIKEIVRDLKPGRERLTLIRLFEELHTLGYAGGHDAVRRYARAWYKRHAATSADAYPPR